MTAGEMALWVAKDYKPFRAGEGVLFTVGEPDEVLWFAHGRPATRVEVMESINGGIPSLEEHARLDGEEAMKDLQRLTAIAAKFIPQAAI